MSNFATNEVVSLEKDILLTENLCETNSNKIADIYEINKCVQWIQLNNFKTVCLQFPNHLLPDSSEVAQKLQNILNKTVYILADTTYESCCIDYIAAAHINADAVIHYGPTCFSKTTKNIPYLNIYEKHNLDVHDFKNKLLENFLTNTNLDIIVDTPYIYCFDSILSALSEFENTRIYKIDSNILSNKPNGTLILLGKDERKLINIELIFNGDNLYYYDGALKRYGSNVKLLTRRRYLIEKIKDSNTIGIVVGTLGVANYLGVIERIKKLISLNSKKYYIISVGKPTVAKLANFPEMDIYVAVTCSTSEIYEDKDFYKPIATPYDLEIALNPNSDRNLIFSYDFNQFLKKDFETEELHGNDDLKADVSLLTNKIRSYISEDVTDDQTNTIVLKNEGTVAVNFNYGAGYLSERSWKGLEQNLGQTEAELAQEGRTGIAYKYSNEDL